MHKTALLRKGRERFLSLQYMAMPLCFIVSNVTKFLFFYAGFAFEENPVLEYGYAVVCLLAAVFCGLCFLQTLRQYSLSLCQWLLIAVIAAFFTGSYLSALLRFGLLSEILFSGELFISFAVPAALAGFCSAMRHDEATFFPTLESFSVLAFPAGLTYANAVFFNCLPWGDNSFLGTMDYMKVAYSLMPFLFVHLICFSEGRAEWVLPFSKKQIRQPQLLRGIFIVVYWVAIIGSGTRGAYVCVILFCCLLLVLKLVRDKGSLKRAFLISLLLVFILSFNLFVYAPPGMNRITRFNMFLEGLAQHEVVTNVDGASVSDAFLNEFVAKDSTQCVVPDGVTIGSRGTLFKLAIKEFLKSPLLGMGPFAYEVKYGLYPHNIILELLCETGLVGTSVMLSLILLAFFRMAKAAKEREDVRMLILFFFGYAVQACISGSIWRSAALLCGLGYGLFCRVTPSIPDHS